MCHTFFMSLVPHFIITCIFSRLNTLSVVLLGTKHTYFFYLCRYIDIKSRVDPIHYILVHPQTRRCSPVLVPTLRPIVGNYWLVPATAFECKLGILRFKSKQQAERLTLRDVAFASFARYVRNAFLVWRLITVP